MARTPDPILPLLEAEWAADRTLRRTSSERPSGTPYDPQAHRKALREWRRAYARLAAQRPTTGEGEAAMLRVAARYISYELSDSPAPTGA